jgi:hypothetical protein
MHDGTLNTHTALRQQQYAAPRSRANKHEHTKHLQHCVTAQIPVKKSITTNKHC